MAGKSKDMSKIKQILRLHKGGMSNRAIGERLSVYKGTVNKYVGLAKSDTLSLDELLELDDPILAKRLQHGTPAYCDVRFDVLQSKLSSITSDLSGNKHTTMYLLWEEYLAEHPDGYGYTQFCYHVNQHQKSSSPSFILSEGREGGQYLYVDFAGDTMSYVNPATAEVIDCQVFVATLPASDYGFAIAVPSQKVDDFLYALECCLRSIGGVPKIIVPDNLKSAVIKADRYQPELNRMFEDFCNHFGCVSIPARARKPKDKALVEDHVKIVYRRVYAPLRNELFFSIQELNKAIAEKMKLHNQKRMQRLPFTREERFLSVDKPALSPLNSANFEIKYTTELTVLDNSHVYMGRDKAYYSVPFQYLRKKVKIIYTKNIVNIYFSGEKIAVHKRGYEQGKYHTIDSHLPSFHNEYKSLSPKKYQQRAAAISETFERIVIQLFQSNPYVPPESFYRSCDGLFHLQKKSDKELFEKACEAALFYGKCQYGFIKNLIESKCCGIENNSKEAISPKTHSNIRGKDAFK